MILFIPSIDSHQIFPAMKSFGAGNTELISCTGKIFPFKTVLPESSYMAKADPFDSSVLNLNLGPDVQYITCNASRLSIVLGFSFFTDTPDIRIEAAVLKGLCPVR